MNLEGLECRVLEEILLMGHLWTPLQSTCIIKTLLTHSIERNDAYAPSEPNKTYIYFLIIVFFIDNACLYYCYDL